MRKLYYETPYIKKFEAKVLSCIKGKEDTYEVIIDQTGFYPEGGGQPSDTGTLGGVSVLAVHEKGGEILHYTDKPLTVGSKVEGIIDWDSRYSNMQQHSGEHLFSGLVHRRYGYDNVGFHMGRQEITVDFNGILTMEQAETIEEEANAMIYQNLPVIELYPEKEELEKMEYRSKKKLDGQVRIIEIPGGDRCACCGTHVNCTGEIGLIKITGLIHYKGGVRLSMLCGWRALTDYKKRLKQVTELSNLLSAKPDLVVDAVEKLKKESSEKDGKLACLYQQILASKAEHYPENEGSLIIFENQLSPVQLRQFCTMLYESGKGSLVLVCSEKDSGYQYALGSGSVDMRAVSKALNKKLNGRGGGSALLAQGTFLAEREEIMKAFEEESAERGF